MAGETLRKLLISVDSSTSLGRLILRFRLSILPLIPAIIFLSVSVQQLFGYYETFQGYYGMYDQASFKYAVARVIFELNSERSAFAYEFVMMPRNKESISNGCFDESSTSLAEAINNTDQILEEYSSLEWNPSNSEKLSHASFEFQKISSFKEPLKKIRKKIYDENNTNCSQKFIEMLATYTNIITFSIEYLPDFSDADLSKITFMHIYALQLILEAHEHLSTVCYLASDHFAEEPLLDDMTSVYLIGNLSVGFEMIDNAFALDNSLTDLFRDLLSNQSDTVRNFKQVATMLSTGDVQLDFQEWHETCRKFIEITEKLEIEVSHGERREGFDMEWKTCVTGITIYSIGIFLVLIAIIINHINSEVTVKNVSIFSKNFKNYERQLNEEKVKTEMLLFEMLPRSVALQLEKNSTVEAEMYEEATIYFSDIVGFSENAFSLDPKEVVEFLSFIYNLLDAIIQNYDVYKVETIGSVYMVVSGVPVRNGEQHVTEVADMSLDILATMEQQSFHYIPCKVELRIGIHTGPCVAGVVGNKMTRYCLFGDAVNTASRMQSTGLASKIHLSQSTYNFLNASKNYILIERGTVTVKGKGQMTTYWLVAKND